MASAFHNACTIYAGTANAGEQYLEGNPKKQIGFILNPRYC
jgi:hypothetical protein